MKTKSKNLSRKKCSLCKGDVCIHEHGEKMTDTLQAIPDMAEQTMDLLEKLLKERENNPEEILHLASRSDLVKLEIVYSKISFEILCCLKYMNIFHEEVLHASSYNQLCVNKICYNYEFTECMYTT